MNRHTLLPSLLAAASAIIISLPAHADIVVDQSQTDYGGTLNPDIPWYQTFRPALDNIISVDVWTRADSGGVAGVELLDGPCGNVLASGQVDVFGVGTWNVAFDGGPVSVTPGQDYALRFLVVDGDFGFFRGSPDDAYLEGALHLDLPAQYICTDPYLDGDWDFMFRTYGENGVVPTVESSWSQVKAIYR